MENIERDFNEFVKVTKKIEEMATVYQNALLEIVQHNVSFSANELNDMANAYADLKDIARKALGLK